MRTRSHGKRKTYAGRLSSKINKIVRQRAVYNVQYSDHGMKITCIWRQVIRAARKERGLQEGENLSWTEASAC